MNRSLALKLAVIFATVAALTSIAGSDQTATTNKNKPSSPVYNRNAMPIAPTPTTVPISPVSVLDTELKFHDNLTETNPNKTPPDEQPDGGKDQGQSQDVALEEMGENGEIPKFNENRRHGRLLKNILIAKIPSPQVGTVLPKAFFTAGVATRNSGGGWGSGGGLGGGLGGGGGGLGGGGGGWGGGNGGGGGGWGGGGGGGGGGAGGWGGRGTGGWGSGGGGWGGGGGGWGGGGGGGWGLGGGGGGWGWGPPGDGWGGWMMQCVNKKVAKAKAKAKKRIAKAKAKAEKKAAKAGGGGWGGGGGGGGWGGGPGGGGGGWNGGGGGGGHRGGGGGGNGGGGWGGQGGGGGWRGGSGGGVGGGSVGGGGGGGGWRGGSGGGVSGGSVGGVGGGAGWRSLQDDGPPSNSQSDIVSSGPSNLDNENDMSGEIWPNSPPRNARLELEMSDLSSSSETTSRSGRRPLPTYGIMDNSQILEENDAIGLGIVQAANSGPLFGFQNRQGQSQNQNQGQGQQEIPVESLSLVQVQNPNGLNIGDLFNPGQQNDGSPLPETISLRLVCGTVPQNPGLCHYVRN